MHPHHASLTAPSHAAVIARAADVIAVPKAAPADSFVLHAPLELMARVGLLAHLPASRQADAIGMIEWLTDQYLAAGDPVEAPVVVDPAPAGQLAPDLVAALADGALDRVDALSVALLPQLPIPEIIRQLGEAIVPSLAAAGHAPIGLALLARVPTALPTTLLRGALRGIASQPLWRVHWHEHDRQDGDATLLAAALRATPMLGRPGSDFIFPLMSQVQDSGVAEQLLAPVLTDRFDVRRASATITRAALWSMVHDDPSQAPYGWSHALTMPQAVMSLAGAGVRPRTALAVAATFEIGFRAAHGRVTLPEVIEPGTTPDVSFAELALAASLHEDAHLVKYTLACMHAAKDDPEYAPLSLTAAARLHEWWATV